MLMASPQPGFLIPQEAVYVSPGSNIVLKAIWNQTNSPGLATYIWKRCVNNSFIKLDTRGRKYHECSCHKNSDTYELTINNIEYSDEGAYRVDVNLTSGILESKLITLYVLKDVNTIGKEELNFLRYKDCDSVAREALHITLERYLQQNNTDLATHLRNYTLLLTSNAVKLLTDQKKHLYPSDGSPVSLRNLDVSLLYKLLRNTTNIQTPKNNWNNVPPLESIGEGDDVERIHQYRNFVAHAECKNLSDEEFEEKWFDLTGAIDRLSKGTLRKRLCLLRNKKFEQGKLPKNNRKQIVKGNSNENSIPVVSQLKSLEQAMAGDVEVALRTQEDFSKQYPVVSQVRSAVEAMGGDFEATRETQKEFLRGLMDDKERGNENSMPVVSQLKSLKQAMAGDFEGARRTQEEFSKRFPIVSQVRSAVEAMSGDFEVAKETQREFLRGMMDEDSSCAKK